MDLNENESIRTSKAAKSRGCRIAGCGGTLLLASYVLFCVPAPRHTHTFISYVSYDGLIVYAEMPAGNHGKPTAAYIIAGEGLTFKTNQKASNFRVNGNSLIVDGHNYALLLNRELKADPARIRYNDSAAGNDYWLEAAPHDANYMLRLTLDGTKIEPGPMVLIVMYDTGTVEWKPVQKMTLPDTAQ